MAACAFVAAREMGLTVDLFLPVKLLRMRLGARRVADAIRPVAAVIDPAVRFIQLPLFLLPVGGRPTPACPVLLLSMASPPLLLGRPPIASEAEPTGRKGTVLPLLSPLGCTGSCNSASSGACPPLPPLSGCIIVPWAAGGPCCPQLCKSLREGVGS